MPNRMLAPSHNDWLAGMSDRCGLSGCCCEQFQLLTRLLLNVVAPKPDTTRLTLDIFEYENLRGQIAVLRELLRRYAGPKQGRRMGCRGGLLWSRDGCWESSSALRGRNVRLTLHVQRMDGRSPFRSAQIGTCWVTYCYQYG